MHRTILTTMQTRVRWRSRLFPGCVALALLIVGFAAVATGQQVQGAAAADAPKAASKGEAAADATNGTSTADANKSSPKEGAVPQSTTDKFGQILKAIQEFISGILTWAVVTLILLTVFRDRVKELLKALNAAIQDRGVSLDVGTIVKLQVAEPPVDSVDELKVASESPFDMPDDSSASEAATLREIVPQLTFDISDSVGRFHKDDNGGQATQAMRAARDALRAICEKPGRTDAELKGAIVDFARKFEATCFLEGRLFADLLNQYAFLRAAIDALPAADPTQQADSFLVLTGVANAYAQKGRSWPAAGVALQRIALKAGAPWYLPAGAVWISCQYHAYIATLDGAADGDLDSAEYCKKVNELAAVGEQFVQAIRAANWQPLGFKAPHGFYIREALKGLGFVLSIAADYPTSRDQRRQFLDRSEPLLKECAGTVIDEAASAIDFNNLADLYRQFAELTKPDAPDKSEEYYRQAVDYSRLAIATPDPAFFHTRALIFFSQGKLVEALETLAEYGAAQAEHGDEQDLTQYIENQILAAKLLSRAATDHEPPDRERIAWTLERAAAFAEAHRARLGDEETDTTIARIDQLLGFAHLHWQGHERKAIAAIDHRFSLRHSKISPASGARSRLYRGQAWTRWARTQRRQFTRGSAASARKDAAKDLMAIAAWIRPIVENQQPPGATQQRTWRLALDIAVALQALADECFAAEETAAARELADEQGKILTRVRAARLDGTIVGDDRRQVFERLDGCEKRRAFLNARIAIRNDPTISDDKLVHDATVLLDEARGLDADLDCYVDLVLGELLLTAARLGKGEVVALYRAAIDSLERAIRHDAPTVRAEAAIALAAAYAARRSILRKTKASAAEK
jgi:hypothetical protein